MKLEYYNIDNYNCVIRTFVKLLDKSPIKIEKELNDLANELDYDNYNEVEVFEKYLNLNNYNKISMDKLKIGNLENMNGKYAVFCHKDDFYHMIPIINNTVFDKNKDILDFEVITIYKNS